MKNEIEKNSTVKRKDLDERFYFSSLINQAFDNELIDIETIANIQLQCFKLLKIRAERYNGFDSTSISTDKANSINESNLYTVSLYLKKFIPDEAIEKLKNESIIDFYNKGRKIIDRKLDISRVLYKKVTNNMLEIDNYTYNATLIGGIKGFFKIYDPDFEANNIKITADYPIYNNLIGVLDGIEFIESYLQSIYYENELCNMFSTNAIKYLLYAYENDYKDLIINIFEIVITALIGCKIADEEINRLTIPNYGLERIYSKLKGKSKYEVYNIIIQTYNEVAQELFKENIELQKYIEKNIAQIQFEVYNAMELNNLDKVFIVGKFIDNY